MEAKVANKLSEMAINYLLLTINHYKVANKPLKLTIKWSKLTNISIELENKLTYIKSGDYSIHIGD